MTRIDNKTNKTLAQQQKDWDMNMRQTKTNYGRIIDNLNDRIINTTINGINETAVRERQRRLSEFSTEALEQELLSRQNCQFGRLACTQKAEE